jgi:esterase/lipase
VVEKGITGAKGEWLAGAGHVITMREQREAFATAIINWLQQH